MRDDATDLYCSCGSTSFERVIVWRRGHAPYLTDFLACAICRVMFFAPQVDVSPSRPIQGCGGAALPWNVPDPDEAKGKGFYIGRGGREPEAHPWTPEEIERFMAVVRRANKAKKRRR